MKKQTEIINEGEPTLAKLTGLEKEASVVSDLLARMRASLERHDSTDANLSRELRRRRAKARRDLEKQIRKGESRLGLLLLGIHAVKAMRAGACGAETAVDGVPVFCELPVHPPLMEHEGYFAEGAIWQWA